MKQFILPKEVNTSTSYRRVRVGDPAEKVDDLWSCTDSHYTEKDYPIISAGDYVYHFTEYHCWEEEDDFLKNNCYCVLVKNGKVVEISKHKPYGCPHRKSAIWTTI